MRDPEEHDAAAQPAHDAKSPRRRRRRWMLATSLCMLGVAGGCALVATTYVAALAASTPGVDALQAAQSARPSVLRTADGKTLQVLRQMQHEPVPLERVAPAVTQALIATEDQRFHEHDGVDVRRTF